MKDKLLGILAAATANAIFGLNIPVTKALVAHWMSPMGYILGILLVILCVFFYAGYLVMTRKVAVTYTPVTIAKWMFLISALALVPLAPSELPRQAIYSGEGTLLAFSLLGFALLFSTTLAFFCLPLALKKLEASTVSIFMNLQPIVASVVAIMAAQDTLTWDKGLAAMLVYPTAMATRSKVRQVICPLGVGAYFEYWGYAREKIHEGDWNDTIDIGRDLIVHLPPARHYSGRLFKENKTFWAGFAIVTPDRKIFYSGDSGYGPHFSKIGKKFNGFDLVMLDCGQYDPRWAYIHMTPKEACQAAMDLGAKTFIPAHVGRFTIANHPWDEPFRQLTEAGNDTSYRLLTPESGNRWLWTGHTPSSPAGGKRRANAQRLPPKAGINNLEKPHESNFNYFICRSCHDGIWILSGTGTALIRHAGQNHIQRPYGHLQAL